MKQIGNNIKCFIRGEHFSKFGANNMLIMDGGPKLVANATKVYLARHRISHFVIKLYQLQAKGRFKRL